MLLYVWLASRYINTNSNYANFGVRNVNSGNVNNNNLFNSNGNTNSPSYAARAVDSKNWGYYDHGIIREV